MKTTQDMDTPDAEPESVDVDVDRSFWATILSTNPLTMVWLFITGVLVPIIIAYRIFTDRGVMKENADLVARALFFSGLGCVVQSITIGLYVIFTHLL